MHKHTLHSHLLNIKQLVDLARSTVCLLDSKLEEALLDVLALKMHILK